MGSLPTFTGEGKIMCGRKKTKACVRMESLSTCTGKGKIMCGRKKNKGESEWGAFLCL